MWRFAHAEVSNYALRRRIEAENNGNKYLKNLQIYGNEHRKRFFPGLLLTYISG
jgi:hypothetical protein